MNNIGSCGLHINYSSYKLLKACFALFRDSPHKQADFVSVAGFDMFLFAFCSTRLVEDKEVTDH